jgi:hypothetical protein
MGRAIPPGNKKSPSVEAERADKNSFILSNQDKTEQTDSEAKGCDARKAGLNFFGVKRATCSFKTSLASCLKTRRIRDLTAGR